VSKANENSKPSGWRPLQGQKALVTGANSGIGRAVALALGAAGADVGINYVTYPEATDAVVGEIRKSGAEALALEADVSDEEQVIGMFRAAIEHFGRLDILVANAGVQRDARFVDMTLKRLGYCHRDQSDRPVSVLPRGGARDVAAGCCP
jgi:glucose 1-dehydrogenase